VAVGVRVALVDDVGEGLQRVQRLPPGAPHSLVRAAHGHGDRDDGEHVPRVVEREQRQDGAEPCLGGGGREIRLQHLQPADDLEQAARDQQVDEREHDQRDEVVRKREAARMASAEQEGVPGRYRGHPIGRSLEGGVTPRPAQQAREQGGHPGHERPAPRAQHDHGGEVDPGGDAEGVVADGLAHTRAVGLLE
jgi:hypothetical protein